jgi:hypothetical protein
MVAASCPGGASRERESDTSHISTTSTVSAGQRKLIMTIGPLPDAPDRDADGAGVT